jgi:DNA-binding NtrC family response regulator
MTPFDAVLDRPSPAETPARSAQAVRLRVLVADDQREVIDALRLLLGVHEIVVTGAATPGEALSLAGMHTFDAAVVDLNYGKGRTTGEQGLDLVAALRKLHAALPVIVMSAWGSAELVSAALRRGARDFVEKPWDELRMATAVRTQAELGRALRQNAELQAELKQIRTSAATSSADGNGQTLAEMRLLEVEGLLVRQAMTKHDGNVSRAARALGLSRSALYRRLERHKI